MNQRFSIVLTQMRYVYKFGKEDIYKKILLDLIFHFYWK